MQESLPVAEAVGSPISQPRWSAMFWLTWTPAGLAVGGLLFLLGYSLTSQSQAQTSGLGGQTMAHTPAHDFNLPRFDGGTLRLADLKGQPVMINFWASWCVPCREEAPILQQTWEEYRDKGVVFVGVDIWDTEVDARAFIKEFGITYPNTMDRDGQVAIDYGVRGVPETFFVDRGGNLAAKYVGPALNAGSAKLQLGALDPNYLINTLNSLLR